MKEKATRIFKIIYGSCDITIIGDLYVKDDLKLGNLEAFEVTGDLWIDGKVEAYNCDITAKSVTILGGCWVRDITSTAGNIHLAGGNEISAENLTSAADIEIEALEEIAEIANKAGTATGCADISCEMEAEGNIKIYNAWCNKVIAKKDIIISFSLCAFDEESCIKAKNIYGKKAIANQFIAEDAIYLQEEPEAFSLELPIMNAKEIIIEEN